MTYYYDKNNQKIYLFLGTNSDKIKIYCIDENNRLYLRALFCNRKGNLLVFEDNNFAIYKLYDNKYEKEKEFIGEDNETINLYST